MSTKRSPAMAGEGKAGMILSVVSAGGGAGKSTVSMAVAQCCRKKGLSVLLLDGDCQFGDMARMAKEARVLSLGALQVATDEPLAEEGSALAIAAPDAMEYAEHWIPLLPQLARRAVEEYDVVVVNTSGVWTDPLLSLMEASDRVLFVVGQSSSSVLGARRAIDLCMRCSVATGSFLFLLNRCTRHSLFTSIDVSCALGGAHVLEVLDGGSVVEELHGCGLAKHLVRDGNPLYKSVEEVLREVLPAEGGTADADVAAASATRAKVPERRSRLIRRRGSGAEKKGKHRMEPACPPVPAGEASWL